MKLSPVFVLPIRFRSGTMIPPASAPLALIVVNHCDLRKRTSATNAAWDIGPFNKVMQRIGLRPTADHPNR